MAQGSIAPLVRQRLVRWNQQHPNHQIDLRALEAVGGREGYSGRIGDQGTSFGPFQLHYGGAYPTSAPRGTPQQSQAWATSPQGIDYALGQIGGVAGGLQGRAAVNAIVRRFERPANPNAEVAASLAAYGLGGAGAPLPSPGAPAAATAGLRPPLPPRALPVPTVPTTGSDYSDFYGQLAAHYRSRDQQQPNAPAVALAGAPPLAGRGTPMPGVGGIAKTALTQLGTPYQWGGPAKLGSRTDCSGLLQASARANGINIGRTTYEQFKQGTPVSLKQLQPGDAIFSEPTARGPGHVAIYIGNGRVVEDPHTGASVRISTLAGRRGIVGARRY